MVSDGSKATVTDILRLSQAAAKENGGFLVQEVLEGETFFRWCLNFPITRLYVDVYSYLVFPPNSIWLLPRSF